MNRYETWFCGTRVWRWITRRQLLPWILQGSELGEHVLELGAGPGAATEELRRLAARVTSLEYDHAFAAKLGARVNGSNAAVIQGDAAMLPFADGAFSSAGSVFFGPPFCLYQHDKSPPLGKFLALLPRGAVPSLFHPNLPLSPPVHT